MSGPEWSDDDWRSAGWPEFADADTSELIDGLSTSLGIEDAQGLVRRLLSLSTRLWTPPEGNGPRPETFHSVVWPPEAGAVAKLLSAHGERVDPWPGERLAEVDREPAYGWRWEATAVLVTGALALGAMDRRSIPEPGRMLNILLHVAFADDELTLLTRRAILIGAGDPWPPPLPDSGDWPNLRSGCLMDIQDAGARLATAVSRGRHAETTIAMVDADGITSLSPTTGTSGDPVAILGTFPATARTVLFPRAGGGTAPATMTNWDTSRIDVLAPEPVGDGPVGFVTDSGAQMGIDPSASVDFAEVISGCLGEALGPAAGRLSGIAPGGLASPRQDVPRLPGDVNVFHGGPVLVGASPTSGAEPGPRVTVTGNNLASGDKVVIDGTAGPTTFVNTTTLTFTPPAIAAGNRFLQIGRGYRRSNGLPFDVRASLSAAPPPGRVPPGAYAVLKGTGFGPTITATVDGAITTVRVFDTHTLEVRVRRPSRPPLASQLRGEPVPVEVFDRGRSLGSVNVTIDTFRIASFGDSIVWGQGLLESDKFTMLVADTITARRGGSIAVFALDRFAHSGAVIAPVVGEAPDPAAPRPPGDFSGECPFTAPSVTAQLAGWSSATLSPQRGEIDLVIVDGGINDVSVTTILDPFASDAALAASTTAACFTSMRGLLTTVLTTFPAASVVVTGYYPIVSDRSDIAFLLPMIGALGLLGPVVLPLVPGAIPIGFDPIAAAIFYAWVRQRLIDRSARFSTVANASLAAAVTAAGPRVALAIPAFTSANSIFAPDAFLFGVGLSTAGLVPLDPVAGSRVAACGTGSVITTVASIGHPNVRGAKAYADAIIGVLPRLGL